MSTLWTTSQMTILCFCSSFVQARSIIRSKIVHTYTLRSHELLTLPLRECLTPYLHCRTSTIFWREDNYIVGSSSRDQIEGVSSGEEG